MRMIKCGAKQRAAVQAARELTSQLLHSSDRRHLWHVFLQHFEILEQQSAFVFQCWLKQISAMHCIFDLPKYPRIGHGAATDQNAVAACFAKAIERMLNRSYI